MTEATAATSGTLIAATKVKGTNVYNSAGARFGETFPQRRSWSPSSPSAVNRSDQR